MIDLKVIKLTIIISSMVMVMIQDLLAQNVERLMSFQELKDFSQSISPYIVTIQRESVLKENYHRPGDLIEWGYGLFIQDQGILTYEGWLQKKSDEESRRAELKLEFWQLNDERKRLEEQRIDLAEKSFGSCPTPIN